MNDNKDNQNWISMIHNPEDSSVKASGLDAKLVEMLLKGGHINKDIFYENVEIQDTENGIPQTLLNDSRYSKNRIVALWAAWLAARSNIQAQFGQGDVNKIKGAIDLFHDNDIIPWADSLSQDKENPMSEVFGIDIIFCSGRIEEKGLPNLIEAFGRLPEKSKQKLIQRLNDQEHLPSWMTCAANAKNPKIIQWLTEQGLTKTEGLQQGYDPYIRATRSTLVSMATSFGTPKLARRHVFRTHESIPIRMKILDELDRMQDNINGVKPQEKNADDQLINTVACGSISFQKWIDKSGRLPIHRHGDGLGITILVAAIRTTQTKPLSDFGYGFCQKAASFPAAWWENLKTQEAAGMEGTGLSEMDCINVGLIILGVKTDNLKKWAEKHLNEVLEKIDKQEKYNITFTEIWEKLVSNYPDMANSWSKQLKKNYNAKMFKDITQINQDQLTQIQDYLRGNGFDKYQALNLDDAFVFNWQIANACLVEARANRDEKEIKFWQDNVIDRLTISSIQAMVGTHYRDITPETVNLLLSGFEVLMGIADQDQANKDTKKNLLLDFLNGQWNIDDLKFENKERKEQLMLLKDSNGNISGLDFLDYRARGLEQKKKPACDIIMTGFKHLTLKKFNLARNLTNETNKKLLSTKF